MAQVLYLMDKSSKVLQADCIDHYKISFYSLIMLFESNHYLIGFLIE